MILLSAIMTGNEMAKEVPTKTPTNVFTPRHKYKHNIAKGVPIQDFTSFTPRYVQGGYDVSCYSYAVWCDSRYG